MAIVTNEKEFGKHCAMSNVYAKAVGKRLVDKFGTVATSRIFGRRIDQLGGRVMNSPVQYPCFVETVISIEANFPVAAAPTFDLLLTNRFVYRNTAKLLVYPHSNRMRRTHGLVFLQSFDEVNRWLGIPDVNKASQQEKERFEDFRDHSNLMEVKAAFDRGAYQLPALFGSTLYNGDIEYDAQRDTYTKMQDYDTHIWVFDKLTACALVYAHKNKDKNEAQGNEKYKYKPETKIRIPRPGGRPKPVDDGQLRIMRERLFGR